MPDRCVLAEFGLANLCLEKEGSVGFSLQAT
jgi:hypothetical protein